MTIVLPTNFLYTHHLPFPNEELWQLRVCYKLRRDKKFRRRMTIEMEKERK